MQDNEMTAEILRASRVRKGLFWMRARNETVPDQLVESIIRSGVWRQWGARLGTILMQDMGMDSERASDWTVKAIEWGCEDARTYGC